MPPTIKFDQVGNGTPGVIDRSREDIVTGQLLTVTAAGVVGNAAIEFLDTPPGSSAALSVVTSLTSTTTPDISGGYRVRVTDDDNNSTVIKTFTVATAVATGTTGGLGLLLAAHNERASADANDADPDVGGAWVAASETNSGGTFKGWHTKLIAAFKLIDVRSILTLGAFPSTFSGQAGKVATVNSGETSVEFTAAGNIEMSGATLGKYIGANSGTGIVSGGLVTFNATANQFDVAAGVAQHVDPNDPLAVPTRVNFGPFIGVTPDDIGTTIFTILAISQAGALVQSKVLPDEEKRRTDAVIQDVSHVDFATITSISTSKHFAVGVSQALLDYVKALGPVNVGNQYAAATAANLTIAKMVGSTILPFINGALSILDPNRQPNPEVLSVVFVQVFRDSTAPTGFNLSIQTNVPAGFYDDGSDVLQTVTMNKWAIYWLDFSNNGTALTIGQAVYNSMAEACSAVLTENPITVPAVANVKNTRRTAIVVKGNTTDLTNTDDAVFVELGA